MRLLVFCGTRKAIEKFDAQADWRIILPVMGADQNEKTLRWFQAEQDAKLAVTRAWLTGWRAPADTAVLFDPSWPYDMDAAESIQAVSRVARLSLPRWPE